MDTTQLDQKLSELAEADAADAADLADEVAAALSDALDGRDRPQEATS